MKHSPRILIADDDPLSLRKLEFLLVAEGFSVSTAADGEQALRLLEADDPPPLAILDVMMPKLDGVEVCRRVRARPRAVPSHTSDGEKQ
jgi:CheY-like chemotaxis protein